VEVVISALPNVWLVLLPKQLTALIAKLDTTLRTPPAQVFKIKYIFLECPSKCSSTCSFKDGNVVCDSCASGYFGVNCD
jgi:hypothetical protein